MGVAVSSSHIVSASPSSSHSSPAPVWGTSQRRQFFTWVLPMGCSSSQTPPVWVRHGATSPASKPAPVWASLSVGPQVLPGACSSASCPQGHSLLWASTCSSVGSSMDCSGSLLHGEPPCAAGRQPALLQGLQGNLCSGAWSTSSPSFFTDLVVCRVVSLTSAHSSLWLQVVYQVFFTLLSYVIPEALPLFLMGSALVSSGSVLEPAGTGFIRHGGSFWQLLTEATPIAPSPLPKPCHANPVQRLTSKPDSGWY